MITLNASGGSVTFTFSGNSTYLNDGTITVPVNSLALIIDESNMATFRKAASNDIFVSANIAEFGMTKAELESWYKANMVGSTGGGGGVTSGEVQTMIDESISGKADTSYVDQSVSGKADSNSLATVATSGSYDDLTNKPTIPTVPTSNTAFTNDAGYITSDALSGYAESSAVTEEISAAVSGKANSSDVYTKSETSGATEIATALGNKQDTLSAGTGISIVDNVISATGGGGKAIEGGRGISVTTGATADTVSLNLPISAGTGTYSIQENAGSALGDYSHAEGGNIAYGDYSHAEGYNTMAISAYSHTEGWQTQANGLAAHAEGYTTRANGENSHAEGNLTETRNLGEHASGSYNLSHKASNTFGDSGNTLFSVGNGTSTGTSRHNAFEIRQNGDIYFEYDGANTKLQDKLDEIESVTAAALNNLNGRFGGLSLVKLTQTEYNNLQTKDSNTLYVIVN